MSTMTASNGTCTLTAEGFRVVWDAPREEAVGEDWTRRYTVADCRLEALVGGEWLPVDEHPDYVPPADGWDVGAVLSDESDPVDWEDQSPYLRVENDLLARWGLEMFDIPVVTP